MTHTQAKPDSVLDLPDLIDELMTALYAATAFLSQARTFADSLPLTTIQTSFDAPFNPPSNGDYETAWRAVHRSGTPGKIVSDPELKTFTLGMIRTATYAEIVAAVAVRFPPERHISSSGLQRFWAAHRDRPASQS